MMTMNNPNDNEKPRADWGQLAQEALDLWQNHLTALASDAAAKDEMAQFVAPMSQMFTQWASMMQSGFSGVMPQEWSGSPSASTATPPPATQEPAQEPVAEHPVAPPQEKQPEEESPPLAVTPNKEEESLAPPSKPESAAPRDLDDGKKLAVSNVAPTASPQQAARRRAALAAGSGDLAQLAGRLAKLERELEALRARPKRSASDDSALASADADAETASASSDAGDDERVARPRS